MSTFGKKALEVWDYDYKDKHRFVASPKNIQLAILEKWYPVGESGYFKNTMTEIEISAYAEYTSHYGVVTIDEKGYSMTTNPLNLKLPIFERNITIEKLLK
jgi:hypothetical protein